MQFSRFSCRRPCINQKLLGSALTSDGSTSALYLHIPSIPVHWLKSPMGKWIAALERKERPRCTRLRILRRLSMNLWQCGCSNLLSAMTQLTTSVREHHLQLKLIELQGLLAQTQNEPRLKGPFPVALYRTILTSLQSILDMLHSLRCATTQEAW